MPDYKCRIALKDGGIAERVIQSDSVSALKKMIARDGGFLISSEKKLTACLCLRFLAGNA